ncbi:MAG: PhnA domain-containing protein [Campylobacterota bacterium]|nr:PhnA domain-containing protein [Campylobacterota bacterium]
MSVEQELKTRSESKCELCSSMDNLSVYAVTPSDESADQSILVCSVCKEQLEDFSKMDENHWHCLNDSMWSVIPAVQVVAYRILTHIKKQDLLDMMYLEDDLLAWAKQGIVIQEESAIVHKDSNGVTLEAGDTVVLIKDLDVKGAGFTAKRGTAVRKIGLTDNPEHIEGRVEGQRIVILTKFVKKS